MVGWICCKELCLGLNFLEMAFSLPASPYSRHSLGTKLDSELSQVQPPLPAWLIGKAETCGLLSTPHGLKLHLHIWEFENHSIRPISRVSCPEELRLGPLT